jgi:hypothetical protein
MKARVRVSVLDPDGIHFVPESRLVLTHAHGQMRMDRETGRSWYEARVDPGEYELSIETPDSAEWQAESRKIRVPEEGKDVRVHLGRPDWPSYRIGETVVPFRPPVELGRDLVAVIFDGRQPGRDLEDRFKRELSGSDQSALEPISVRAGGSIWILRMDSSASTVGSVERTLHALASADSSGPDYSVRVGVPVNLTPNRLTVLTNRFLVKFVSPDNVGEYLSDANVRIVRHNFVQNRRLKLIELDGTNFLGHLKIIDDWYKAGIISYSEPELVQEVASDAFDPSQKPADPEFDKQKNLIDQGVVEAWRYLHDVDPALTLGSSSIYVATIDMGVNPEGYPECNEPVSDGSPQLATCFDFKYMIPCSDAGYIVYDGHGMGVYGIISARTDNENDIAGIAPNCHHIGIRFSSITAPKYFDMLLWTAGFQPFEEPDAPPPGWPQPIAHGADIINCSHAPNSSSILVDDTFEFLAKNGRDGLGTIVVYSAGNFNQDITLTGNHKLAESAHTLAISCTELRNCFEVRWDDPEFQVIGSNYGESIDLCARGTGTRTINQNGVPNTMGGTSSAAPAVSATIALMLSVCPKLSLKTVRDILRATAKKVDPYPDDPSGAWEYGHSRWYGYGRLEIGAAVKAAHAACPDDDGNGTG